MAKKLKRMTKQELRAPDEVQVKLQGLWTWIENYWRHLAITASVLVVGGGVATVMDNNSQAEVYADADALGQALASGVRGVYIYMGVGMGRGHNHNATSWLLAARLCKGMRACT